MKRVLGVAALLLGVVAMSVGSAGLAVAQGSGGTSNNSSAPPGNNGTIKIDQTALDDHANHPHVDCKFYLSFFGFDAGIQTTHVAFTAQPPSGNFGPVSADISPTDFTFTGHGAGGTLDKKVPYELDVAGLKEVPNQGFHIKVDVEVTGSTGSDDKYKVFWYKPCGEEHHTTTTTGETTTTVKHHTTTTLTPSSSSVPEEGSTTTTTVKHHTTTTLTPSSSSVPEEGSTTTTTLKHGTTTTSTTLTPTSSSLPERGTTTTSTTKPRSTTTTSTTSPPTASGQAPGSRSGLAFTSGPTPSGAGTDLGFFGGGRGGDESTAPWLSLIVGGVLLSGVGAFTLRGGRIRKWVRRA